MSDKQAIWERQDGESTRWYSRFVLFRDMGATRSLLGAVNVEKNKKGQNRTKNIATSWREACEQWQWRQRAEAWDEHEQRRLEAQRQAYVDSIMEQDYALKHERIKAYVAMAHRIEQSYVDQETGDIIYQWLTPDKIREWRGCLDDIAKVLGERDSKGSVKIKSEGPVEYISEWGGGAIDDDDDESDNA